MRIGEVIGTVTLSRSCPEVVGAQWKIVVPFGLDGLLEQRRGDAEEVIVYDEWSAGLGEWIAFSEGGEAAKPFYPDLKPVDAYCAAILDTIEIDHRVTQFQ
ncbi:MAG: carbon dioxide concentrating mechanism protein CcmL [Planctomycetaceae bacterium]|jgi:ethanolamine utilization protein EutN|nr:carbon dioxide concentrating mechanism protein CcmL [Planctomycetaceae bacterium]